MQPVKSFKRMIQLSKELNRFLAQEGLLALPISNSGIKSLSDFLEEVPICNEDDDPAMLPCLLLRAAGQETFNWIPMGVFVDTLIPYDDGESDAELEEHEQEQIDTVSGMIRSIIQLQSVGEYIVCADSYHMNQETGEHEEGILLVHSDSPTSERLTFLPYTYTEVDGFVFGKAVCKDNSTGRFCRFMEETMMNSPIKWTRPDS